MGAEYANGDHQTPRSVLENDDEDWDDDDWHLEVGVYLKVCMHLEAMIREIEKHLNGVVPTGSGMGIEKNDESKSLGTVHEDIMVDSVPEVTPSSVPNTTPTEAWS